jgi:CubicO group peptidase (beta-lactamase class C family)
MPPSSMSSEITKSRTDVSCLALWVAFHMYLASILLLLSALPFASLEAAQDPSSKIDDYMHAQVTVNRFSGSILIAGKGKIVVSRGYSAGGMKSSTSNTLKTPFRAGSIAMQFTDVAILQLQEKNRVHVQDSICKYIKECPDEWAPITLFDLMVHSSGIPEISDASGSQTSKRAPPTISELVARIKKEPLRFKPGEKVDESYSDDEVLHAVIEEVSGEPYISYLGSHIFIPLRMHHTGYDSALRTRMPSETLPLLMPSDLQRSLFYTAGGLYTTIEDLYLWDRALATDKVASQISLQQMFMPYRDGYGFGWKIQKESDRRLVTPGGGLRSYSTSILRYPDDDACVIVLSRSESTDAARVGHDLAAILFGMQYELPTERKAIKLDPASYDDYVGRYALTSNFTLTVTKEGDHLKIQGTDQAKVDLFPRSKTQFFTSGSDAMINFVEIPNGRVTQMILQQGGHDIPVSRVN